MEAVRLDQPGRSCPTDHQPYLAEASFAQHHQEVEVGQFHPVPVAIVLKFGDGVCRFLFGGLGPLSDLGPLEKEAHRAEHQWGGCSMSKIQWWPPAAWEKGMT